MRRVVLWGALLAGCGRLEFAPLVDAGSDGVTVSNDARTTPFVCGPWTSVMPVPGTTRASNSRSGSIAPDGLSIVWMDDLMSGTAFYQTRTARGQAFSAPQVIPSVPSAIWDLAVLDGGRTLVYAVNGAIDCPLVVTAPQPYQFSGVATELSPGCVAPLQGAYLTTNGLTAYAATQGTGRVARRSSTTVGFTSFTPITEFPDSVDYPAVRDDELELYFENTSAGSRDLWVTTRASTADPWGTPQLVDLVNGPSDEEDVSITADGQELYFDSDRSGVFNLYVATRTCN